MKNQRETQEFGDLSFHYLDFNMKNYIVGTAILFVAIMWLVNKNSASWMGFFYPNGDDLNTYVVSPNTYDNVEDCRNWIYSMANNQDANGNTYYDYECGKNCKPSEYGIDLYVCDETVE